MQFLVTLAVSSLVLTATYTSFCYTLTFPELAESRILHAAPLIIRPRSPLNLFCIFQLWSLCAVRSLATLYLSTTSDSGPGELPGFWGFMVFRQAPIPRNGSGSTTNNKEFVLQLVRLSIHLS